MTARHAIMLNKAEEEMPSTSDVAKADDMELQEYTDNLGRSTENLIAELEGESSDDLPMRELLSYDKQLRRIRGSRKVEAAQKVKLEENIKKEKHKLEEIRGNPEYDDEIREDIRKRIEKYNDELKTRQKKHRSPQR